MMAKPGCRDDGRIDELTKAAGRAAGDLEPWPYYFESKARELKTILAFHGLDGIGSLLEIGCGNGFTAALLSGLARRVEACDLPSRNPRSHSLGIGAATSLIRRLGVKNANVIGASAENLPFDDGSFDVIFSEYAVQYVADKPKALGEMRRVLNDAGRVITIVPNFTERVFAPLAKYSYLTKRALARLAGKAGVVSSSAGGGSAASSPRRLPDMMDDYLLLRADGAYKSFMEEFARHLPSSWKALFEENGFRVTKIFSTQLLPLGLFDILGPRTVRFISEKSWRLNGALGGMPVLKGIGCSLGLIAIKD